MELEIKLCCSRSSVRAACARTQVTFGPATPAPAPVDRPMDIG